MKKLSLMLSTIMMILMLVGQGNAQTSRYGILNQKAPSLGVTQWMNLPEGQETLDISDLKGKVVYLYGFQSW